MPRHNTLLSGVPGLKCDLLGRFTFDLRISSSGRVKIESMETERDTVASDAVTFTLERVAIPCSPARPPEDTGMHTKVCVASVVVAVVHAHHPIPSHPHRVRRRPSSVPHITRSLVRGGVDPGPRVGAGLYSSRKLAPFLGSLFS